MNVVWRFRAEQDLNRQLDYLRKRNPRAAERASDRVYERVGRLEHFPRGGRPSRRPNVRELVITGTPYIVVYRLRGNEITILRLFHGRQRRP